MLFRDEIEMLADIVEGVEVGSEESVACLADG